MPRKVLVNHSQNSQDVLATATGLQQLVVDPEDGQQELPGEREIEFGILTDELSNYGQDVEHTKFDGLVLSVFLSK